MGPSRLAFPGCILCRSPGHLSPNCPALPPRGRASDAIRRADLDDPANSCLHDKADSRMPPCRDPRDHFVAHECPDRSGITGMGPAAVSVALGRVSIFLLLLAPIVQSRQQAFEPGVFEDTHGSFIQFTGSKCENIFWNSVMFAGVSYQHTASKRSRDRERLGSCARFRWLRGRPIRNLNDVRPPCAS